jgi:serine phosphatase RsbU (regulator of sigma subunit)
VCTHRQAEARELLDRLFDDATQYAGAAPQHDDMTLVVIRVFAA